MARDTAADKAKAIGYIEQALSVIEDYSDNNEVRSHPHSLRLSHDLILRHLVMVNPNAYIYSLTPWTNGNGC